MSEQCPYIVVGGRTDGRPPQEYRCCVLDKGHPGPHSNTRPQPKHDSGEKWISGTREFGKEWGK